MYCSHCGKKVNDTMLFCPFCGEPIVIPEQDEPAASAPAADSVPAQPVAAPMPEAAKSETEAAPTPDEPKGEIEAAPTPVPEPAAPSPEPASPPDASEADTPARPAREVGEAEAELLDWDRTRREYAKRDVWANPSPSGEDFSPLDLKDEAEKDDERFREEIARRKEQTAPEKKPPEPRSIFEPAHLDGEAPKLKADIEGAKPIREKPRKGANTLVPPKQMNPKDIFMDGGDDDDDDYDVPAKKKKKKRDEEEFVYEDADEGSFFMRHIRGIVGLALFVILILMFVIFAFSKAGQQSLARINLAWSVDTYTELGAQCFEDGQYAQAALYYERALQRDPQNYDYAQSAVMAYEKTGNKEKEAEMLKRCAEIRPDALEPYFYLLQLYPEADRPWDITQLLQQGYERTGDPRLNVKG